MRNRVMTAVVAALVVAAPASGQDGQRRLESVQEALSISGRLAGAAGPASVNWIEQGSQFSYTTRNEEGAPEVRRYDPRALTDQALFDGRRLTLPGTDEPLAYRSFEFGGDSRFLVFQSDFRPIYRHSGVADYFVYDLEDASLVLGADDARTAELAPGGRRLAYERGGDLFVYDLAAEEEVVIALSHEGYVKQIPMYLYRRRQSSGKALAGMDRYENDYVERLFVATTTETLMFVTRDGQAWWLPVAEIPEAGRVSRGKSLHQLLNLPKDARVVALLAPGRLSADARLVFLTEAGLEIKLEPSGAGETSVTLAAFTIASAASTDPMRPFVSTIPSASPAMGGHVTELRVIIPASGCPLRQFARACFRRWWPWPPPSRAEAATSRRRWRRRPSRWREARWRSAAPWRCGTASPSPPARRPSRRTTGSSCTSSIAIAS